MLWASDALGPDGKPAVLLLGVTRTHKTIEAEVAYVAAELDEGWVAGTYYRGVGDAGESLRLWWPAGWPAVRPTNKLHPRRDTPSEAVRRGVDEPTVIVLGTLEPRAISPLKGETVSNEQAQV